MNVDRSDNEGSKRMKKPRPNSVGRSTKTARAGCSHDAWEENGGWRRCTDCGHGWSASTHVAKGEPPVLTLSISSRHITDYVLINRADGTVWRAALGADGVPTWHAHDHPRPAAFAVADPRGQVQFGKGWAFGAQPNRTVGATLPLFLDPGAAALPAEEVASRYYALTGRSLDRAALTAALDPAVPIPATHRAGEPA